LNAGGEVWGQKGIIFHGKGSESGKGLPEEKTIPRRERGRRRKIWGRKSLPGEVADEQVIGRDFHRPTMDT